MSRRCWRMDSKYDVDVEELLRSGESAFFSFSDDKAVARAEIDWFWRELRRIIDQHPELLRPMLFFEEAQDIFETKDDSVTGSLEEAALKLRKGGIPVCLTMPTLEGVSGKVASVSRDWIIGAIDGTSRDLVRKYTGSTLVWEKIGQLRSDTTGTIVQNDLLYYIKDKKRGVVFNSFECPQEFNRRI